MIRFPARALGLAIVLLWPVPGLAQPAHLPGHWEGLLKKPYSSESCCNLEDCRPTLTRYDGTDLFALTPDGREILVPETAIIPENQVPNGRPGHATLCFRNGVVLCFVFGTPRS